MDPSVPKGLWPPIRQACAALVTVMSGVLISPLLSSPPNRLEIVILTAALASIFPSCIVFLDWSIGTWLVKRRVRIHLQQERSRIDAGLTIHLSTTMDLLEMLRKSSFQFKDPHTRESLTFLESRYRTWLLRGDATFYSTVPEDELRQIKASINLVIEEVR